MFRPLFLFAAAAGLAAAAPMTYTLTGTGSGSWNSTPFTNASFTFTFTSDTSTIVHGTACCSSADTTPSGTSATVTVSGFAPTTLSGDQAIFMNRAEATAGIWHFNSPDYVTIGNPAFASSDLTTPMACCTSGTTFSYVTPMALSTGGTLYFSSVSGVGYAQQSGSSGGTISAVSVTPNSGTQQEFTTQTYTVVVGDTTGAADIGGVDVQFRDKPSQPNACWLYYNAGSNTLAVNHQGNWSAGVPVGSGGSTLTGDGCTVNTTAVTVSTSGNNLTLAMPMQPTFADNNPWQIFVDAQTKANVDAGYSQLGTVTVQAPQGSGTFSLSIGPNENQQLYDLSGYARVGDTLTYAITLTDQNGFSEPVTFSGASYATNKNTGNTTQLGVSFNPPTRTTSGTTTMTVTTNSATPDGYAILVTGTSQSVSQTTQVEVVLENGPPNVTLSRTTGSGSSQNFALNFTGAHTADGNNYVTGLNVLIAPSLDGRNACWIYFDNWADSASPPQQLWLASDDGTSWTSAGPVASPSTAGGSGSASNSQCTIGPGASINESNPGLNIPITFKPGFAGTKTVYVDAVNGAGFDTGYQPLGGWTVP